MKNYFYYILNCSVIMFLYNSAKGEVFDDFSAGEFHMIKTDQNQQAVASIVSSDLFSVREVKGVSAAGVNWNASLVPSVSGISYSVSIDPPQTSPRTYLGIRYIKETGLFDFNNNDYFEIRYDNLVGQGSLYGFLELTPVFNNQFSKPLDGSGLATFPISQLGTPDQLNNSQQLEFRFIVSQDRFGVSEFGINIQEISIVPEPTTWSLLLLGGSPWVWRCFGSMASRKLW